MPQPDTILIPWIAVILGLLLAFALTALILVFIIRALKSWRRNLEESVTSASSSTEKKEAEKLCPRCDAVAAATARFCPSCGKSI